MSNEGFDLSKTSNWLSFWYVIYFAKYYVIQCVQGMNVSGGGGDGFGAKRSHCTRMRHAGSFHRTRTAWGMGGRTRGTCGGDGSLWAVCCPRLMPMRSSDWCGTRRCSSLATPSQGITCNLSSVPSHRSHLFHSFLVYLFCRSS